MASALAEEQAVIPCSASSMLQSLISPSDSISQVVGHQKNKCKSSCVYDEDDVTNELASNVTDVPWGQCKHVRFQDDLKIQMLCKSAENILAIWESEDLPEEVICLGHMVSSDAPLY